MIDHMAIYVRDYAASKAFYLKALKPLGYELVMEFENVAGFGEKGIPDFWIAQKPDVQPLHLAFQSKDRKTVEAFYQAAMEAGGKDNGGPGLRPQYHPTYYAAFVHDPDGHNIEAVCHCAEQ